jgi:HlyD family secretion protein
VRAPVTGRVLERTVRPGDIAASGQVMFRIASAGSVELDAEVPEAQLVRVRQGNLATVTLPSGGTVTGAVRYVDPTVDQQTRLGRARISLPPREDLRLGGFATAVIRDLAAPALSVPEAAVQFDADGAFVMTVGANNRVRRVAVRTGRRNNGFVELVQGPPAGVMVVLSGSAFLVEGDPVRPVLAAAAPARRATPAQGAVRGAAR